VEKDKDGRGSARQLGSATWAEEEKQLEKEKKEALPGSELDLHHSRLCQTWLKLAWQELSLKRRPGSTGEATERPLAWKLILTFPGVPIPNPSPTPNDCSQIQKSKACKSQFSQAAPSPSPGRCASAAALRTPPLFPVQPPLQPQIDSAHARVLQAPFSPARFLNRSPFFDVHRAHAHSVAGPSRY
jgi:hypothetical protein